MGVSAQTLNTKGSAIAALENSREFFMAAARNAAKRIAQQGDGTCTIDMVREQCPPPPGVDPRVMGAVFNTDEWVHCGFTRSNRSTCHKRPISRFRLVE